MYMIGIELDLPPSHANRKLGTFMIYMTLYDR
jgi:hypothetical protein